MLGLAPRVADLGTESAFAVLARARALEAAGRDVVHLEIGQPDLPTPAHVGEAAWAAIGAGETGYCPSAGLPELREVAAAELSSSRGIDVDAERVLVANGAKPLLFFAILATAGPGDEVVLPDPGFPIYASAVRWAGATPVGVRSAADVPAALSERTTLVILNSPGNPTGEVASPAELAAVARAVASSGAWVLSDEVYRRLAYDDEVGSIVAEPAMPERTLVLDSLSKTYAMTGWRCGYAAVPEALVEPLTRFMVNSTSCVPPFVQRGAIAALTGPQNQVEAMVAEYRMRRDLLVAGLEALPGVRCPTPRGAFYAWADVEGTGLDADELAERLLEEVGVAVLAGSAFGANGAGHLRLSYATARERLEEALRRMGELLRAG